MAAKRNRIIPVIILIVVLALFAAIILLFVSVFTIRRINTAVSHTFSYNVAIADNSETRRDILNDFPNLSVIRSYSGLNLGDMHIETGDVKQLNITLRNGSFNIAVHEEPNIWIHSPGRPRYEFLNDQQTLNITADRNASLLMFVPREQYQAIFESISVDGRNGGINIWGINDENVFLSENLHIYNRNGSINLGNIVISSYLNLETRNANINLHNVIADADRLTIATRNGRINILE